MVLADRFSWSSGENERDDETVETQDLGEDENEDHADIETRLLSCASNARVTDDADRETGRQTRQADA